MLQELNVKFNNFLLSLSDAMDMASPSIAAHQIRTAFIAWRIASAADLPKDKIEKIYLAALLHDIGALSLEEKQNIHHIGYETDTDTHCILGEALFESSSLLKPSAKIVRYHHMAWKDCKENIDYPGLIESQILLLSDEIERSILREKFILHQMDKLNDTVVSISGTKVHRDIIDVFMQFSRYEDFWLDLSSPRLYSILLHNGPFRLTEIEQDEISSVASTFRHLVDFKSRFTASHSTGVAECAVMLSRYFGLTDVEIYQMKIAGYFHDLGKLAVPNSILEKPGRLSKEEFEIIKQHTYFTYTVLSTIGGLNQIAEWAAFHHEKLNGSGYPFHITANNINIGARIMAVADIFTALIEDRPYRNGMNRKRIEDILMFEVDNNSLDKNIVNILLDNWNDISTQVMHEQKISEKMFEMKFLRINNKIH